MVLLHVMKEYNTTVFIIKNIQLASSTSETNTLLNPPPPSKKKIPSGVVIPLRHYPLEIKLVFESVRVIKINPRVELFVNI